ncbi:unnamed protein product [Amaranthus hypochondriacus]
MGKNVELMVVIITLSMMQVMGTTNSEIIMDEFGISSGIVKCIPNGKVCITQECCAGNICKFLPTTTVGSCSWCPPAGYSCGLLDPCCLGLSCDGFFSGTCH